MKPLPHQFDWRAEQSRRGTPYPLWHPYRQPTHGEAVPQFAAGAHHRAVFTNRLRVRSLLHMASPNAQIVDVRLNHDLRLRSWIQYSRPR